MTSLLTADGRLLKRTGPSSGSFGQGFVGRGLFDNYAYVDEAGENARLISFSEIYNTQPRVAGAINKLTRQGSTLPLKVYRRDANGERERQYGHPLEVLLRKPLPRKGPKDLKQWIWMPLLTHGNALVAKFRADPDGPPTHLLPVDWRHIEAFAPEGGPVEWWATTQTGERRWISVEDTIHFAWESPDGEVGTSPLRQLGVTVQMEDAAQRYSKAMFKNGARPTGVIQTPEGVVLTEEIRGEIRADLERLYQGIDNAGRPALLPGGLSWEAIAHTAHEAELIEQRYVSWEDIQTVFDVSGPLIADLRHGTYSNVEELNKQLYKSVLRPWLTLIEETIQAHLIDPETEWDGLFVEHDLGEVLKGDPLELSQALKLQVEAGLLTRNEARKFQNMPRVEDPSADELTANMNNQAPLSSGSESPTVEPPDVPPQLT